jgi:predicted transposase YbfD/YdcC
LALTLKDGTKSKILDTQSWNFCVNTAILQVPMIRYYISSAELSAKKLAEAARQHWYIENKLHWSLDVALREDACKIHRGYAAENLVRERAISR